MPRPQLRQFATTTRVYPPYLPYLHVSSRKLSRRWIAPVCTAATGLSLMLFLTDASRHGDTKRQQYHQMQLDEQNAAQKQRQEMLLNAYGDRTSLVELERAVKIYEQEKR